MVWVQANFYLEIPGKFQVKKTLNSTLTYNNVESCKRKRNNSQNTFMPLLIANGSVRGRGSNVAEADIFGATETTSFKFDTIYETAGAAVDVTASISSATLLI